MTTRRHRAATLEPQWQPRQLTEMRHWAGQMGWDSEETFYGLDYRLKAWRRQGEHLCLIWRAEKFSSSESWFESPEVDRMDVPDADAGMNVLRTHQPSFDWSEMDDDTILHYLAGKEITWKSSLTGEPSSAVVPKAKSTRISRSRMRRGFVTFADTSFRSVALDAIIDVR